MNKELELIITDAEAKLKSINSQPKAAASEVEARVVALQKQLLSASVLQKPNLEQSIKIELKQAEIELFALKEDNRELELAFLLQYIKEHYDWFRTNDNNS